MKGLMSLLDVMYAPPFNRCQSHPNSLLVVGPVEKGVKIFHTKSVSDYL